MIKETLYHYYSQLERAQIEKAIEFYACFGGGEKLFQPDLHKDLIDNIASLISRYESIAGRLCCEDEVLLGVFATKDRRIESGIKKSLLDQSSGYKALQNLMAMDILRIEPSRERPPQRKKGQKLKKELRRYRIQHKVRFHKPFYRFWYRYIYPNEELLAQGRVDKLIAIILDDLENYTSLCFEHISEAFLRERFGAVKSGGGYWDKRVELDIVLELSSGDVVVGECKWKHSKVCQKTLRSLQKKAELAGFAPSHYALFSRSGFSNELLKNKDPRLLLFDLEDFMEWLGRKAYRKKEKAPYSHAF